MRQARRVASITAATQRLFSPLCCSTLHVYTYYTVRVNPSITRNPDLADLTSDVAEGVLEVGRHHDGWR